jgi:hypothetical protein
MIARATLLAAGHREVAEDEAVPPGRGDAGSSSMSSVATCRPTGAHASPSRGQGYP